jgi:beta-1,4-mannosyltransferase
MEDSEPAPKLSETNLLITLIIFMVLFRLFAIYIQKRSVSVGLNTSKNVTLVVLGDIGRSPRMQYHALSFARNDWTVDFVGYDGKGL